MSISKFPFRSPKVEKLDATRQDLFDIAKAAFNRDKELKKVKNITNLIKNVIKNPKVLASVKLKSGDELKKDLLVAAKKQTGFAITEAPIERVAAPQELLEFGVSKVLSGKKIEKNYLNDIKNGI